MLEMMLLIFHVSDHQDSEHVLRTWQSLVDQSEPSRSYRRRA